MEKRKGIVMTNELMERSPAELQADVLTEKVKILLIVTVEDRQIAEEMIQGAKALEDEIFVSLTPWEPKMTHAPLQPSFLPCL